MFRKLLKNPQAVIGFVLIVLVILVAVLAPVFAPHDPNETNLLLRFNGPSAEYPLGNDEVGRCELSRLLYGTRYSISISLPVLALLAFFGLFIGNISACAGEKVDHVITFICDVFISFPQIVIAIAVIGIVGSGISGVITAIFMAMWAWFVRVVRSYAVTEMGKDYILAARLSGCGTIKLVFRHLIPNVVPQFLVYISTGIAGSIVMVSGFAFIGLGLPVEIPEWGAMLSSARNTIFTHPELLVYPGICIMLTSAAFNLFGEALRDVLEDDR